MPTTFNVISLGTFASIDPTEGNTIAENASSLVGRTMGTVHDPLWEQVQQFSPGTGGFGGGTSTAYDQNNNLANERFRINGGPNQTFDASAIYNATITYTNGTTADITAVIFQDTAGNTYLAPEFSNNSDQTALQAGPIRSLRLNSLEGNNYSGLTGDRQATNFAVCFAAGTMIETPDGARAVETLSAGDSVITLDHGVQTIRWIGGRTVPAIGPMQPVHIAAGALGHGLPTHRLTVSRQHRIMLRNSIAEKMTGRAEILIAARKLTALPGVEDATDMGFVTYWHFLCDTHEIVYANGVPAETLYLGTETRKRLPRAALEEIAALFPALMAQADAWVTARPLLKHAQQNRLMDRLRRNGKPALA